MTRLIPRQAKPDSSSLFSKLREAEAEADLCRSAAESYAKLSSVQWQRVKDNLGSKEKMPLMLALSATGGWMAAGLHSSKAKPRGVEAAVENEELLHEEIWPLLRDIQHSVEDSVSGEGGDIQASNELHLVGAARTLVISVLSRWIFANYFDSETSAGLSDLSANDLS